MKSIRNPVEISMEIYLKFQWNTNEIPSEIELKFQWNTNWNFNDIPMNTREQELVKGHHLDSQEYLKIIETSVDELQEGTLL